MRGYCDGCDKLRWLIQKGRRWLCGQCLEREL